jgi:hypothetical protein
MCEPSQKRLLAAFGMMESLHHEQLPVVGVVGLIQQRAGHWHPGVCEHRIPASFLVLKPLAYVLTIGCSSRGGHVVGKATQPLAQRKHPQALPLPRPVQQGSVARALSSELMSHKTSPTPSALYAPKAPGRRRQRTRPPTTPHAAHLGADDWRSIPQAAGPDHRHNTGRALRFPRP